MGSSVIISMFHLIKKSRIFQKELTLGERVQFGITYIFRFMIIVLLAAGIWTGHWVIAAFSLFLLLLTFLAQFIEGRYKIFLPVEFEFITAAFVYVALYLGSLNYYYIHYWWWDVAIHTGAGVAFGFLGFIIMYTLYRRDKVKARPFWIALFAFSFAMAAGAVWEIYEFAVDSLLPFNMQKNGLIDTMWDLIVNMVGALFISILGYFYIRGGSVPFVTRIMQKLKKKNPHLFRS